MAFVGRGDTEKRMRLCHHHRRRNTFPAHVANAEKQFFVANEKVEQIATHLSSRNQMSENIEVATLWERWKLLGQHRLLDALRNAQLTADALLLHISLMQTHDAVHGAVDDDTNQQESRQHQQGNEQAHLPEFPVHLSVVAYKSHLPMGAFLHAEVVNVALVLLQ